MRKLFGVTRVSEIPTGVDIEYFAAPPDTPRRCADLVFVGSMDWLPNIDGVRYFVQDVLPLIRRRRPGLLFGALSGERRPASIAALPRQDRNILRDRHGAGRAPVSLGNAGCRSCRCASAAARG